MNEESSAGESTESNEGGEASENGINQEAVELFGGPNDLIEQMKSSDKTPLQAVSELISKEENPAIREGGQEEAQAEGEVSSKPTRMIKLQNGQEYPADTPIEVNGEVVNLGLLVDDYIGQKEINRRFTEFDKGKKQWEQDVVKRFEDSEALTTSKLKKLNELSAEGDHFGVLNLIAQFAGRDPVEFEQQMVTQALDLADKFTEMSEDEIKAHWAEKRADYARGELDRREKEESRKKEYSQQEAQIKQAINSYGLNESQFNEAYSLLRTDEEAMKTLKSSSMEQATDIVCRFYLDSAKEARVERAINEVAPKHPEREKLIDMLFRVADYDYSVEDIREIAEKYLKTGSNKASETQSKEPAKEETAGKPEKAASSGISELSNMEPEDALGWDFT
jgi:hypothetical protein